MSRYQRFLKYLTTQKGKEFSLYCAVTFATSTLALTWLPQSVCLQKYREFLACYKDGFERKVPDYVIQRFKKALDLLEIDELERSRIQLFTVVGFDTFHAGSKSSVYGSIIGVPVNYEFRSTAEIPRSQMVVKDEKINWDSEAGKIYQDSLILTEEEQTFGICKEILHTRTLEMPLNCLYPLIAAVAGYAMGHYINDKLKFFQRPRGMRMVLYGLIGVFIYGNYSFVTDYTHCKYEVDVDKKLASLGDTMVKAGVGYYDKILKRNMAIRTLSGDNSHFSSSGNINHFIRHRSMPLTTRKNFFESKLEDLTFNTQTNIS